MAAQAYRRIRSDLDALTPSLPSLDVLRPSRFRKHRPATSSAIDLRVSDLHAELADEAAQATRISADATAMHVTAAALGKRRKWRAHGH